MNRKKVDFLLNSTDYKHGERMSKRMIKNYIESGNNLQKFIDGAVEVILAIADAIIQAFQNDKKMIIFRKRGERRRCAAYLL